MLNVVCLAICKRPLRGWSPTISSESDILMIADGLLAQPLQCRMLLATKFAYPVGHILHHLPLNFGIFVMEVRVEQALKDLLRDLMDIY